MTALRIGHGYDVHRLVEGRPLVLGGVTIPWERGLLGHSDADVLTHADRDPRYAGISSLKLLAQVGRFLEERGFSVVNIDATLLAQAPKLAPYKEQMAANLAAALGIEAEQISVKATTEEGLGFTGDSSGMAAHAVVLLEKREGAAAL